MAAPGKKTDDERSMREARAVPGQGLAAGERPIGAVVATFARGWERRRDGAAFAGYRFPVRRGGVLRDDTVALFGDFVERHPGADAMTGWARGLAAL